MSSAEPEWLDAAGAARVLRVERSTVWRYVTSGRLVPDKRYGRAPVFHVSTLRAYLDALTPNGRAAFERREARQN